MTIQEAINKAIEGGYPTERITDLSVPVQAQCFLETTFWEALGRALGIEGDFEFIHLSRPTVCPAHDSAHMLSSQ